MIDYYLVDFLVGMSQILTLILLVLFFLSWLVIERHKVLFRNLTILCGVLNIAMLVLTIFWPFVF
jgi:hypothetical protein